MEDGDQDPFDFSPDRLARELCTEDRSWRPPSSALAPDPASLRARIIESGADGEFLIWESVENGSFDEVFVTLGINTVPHRRFIRHAAQQFRLRSVKFQAKLAELKGLPLELERSSLQPGDLGLFTAKTGLASPVPAVASATIPTTRDQNLPNVDGSHAQHEFVEGPSPKKRRVAPVNISNAPINKTPSSIPTQADILSIPMPSEANNSQGPPRKPQKQRRKMCSYFSSIPITPVNFEPGSSDEDEEFSFGPGTYRIPPGHCLAIKKGMQRYLGPQWSTSSKPSAQEEEEEELPLFGDSDSDDGYDSDTQRQIEEEDAAREHQKESQVDRLEHVRAALEQLRSELEEQWRAEKLPRLQGKAHKLWNEARRRRNNRLHLIESAKNTSRHMDDRLAKYCAAIEKDPKQRPSDIPNLRQAFELTVYSKLEADWRAQVLLSPSEPRRTRAQRRAPVAPKEKTILDEGGDEIDIISDTSEDEEAENFIVPDEEDPTTALESHAEASAQLDSTPSAGQDMPEYPSEHSDSSEDVPLSSTKRKAVKRDKAAQSQRNEEIMRMKVLEEKRQVFRAQLANSNVGSKSHLIINEAKDASHGFVYVTDRIAEHIKEHQIEGVRFMWNQVIAETGCLLAHTMGLGKTLQVICLLVAIQEAANSTDPSTSCQIPKALRSSQTLILCPPGLINNWMDELERWVPPGVLKEVHKLNSDIPQELRPGYVQAWVDRGGVLLMGYSLFRSMVTQDERCRMWLTEKPNIVVADEAHVIKNEKSLIAETMKNFKAKVRIAMTGSPLANSVGDYYSMISWVAPNYLGPRTEFTSVYDMPIQQGLFIDSSAGDKRRALKLLKALKDTVAPKVHRMTTHALKGQLPTKKEFVLVLPLTESQFKTYEIYMDWLRRPEVARDQHTVQLLGQLSRLSVLLAHPQIFLQTLLKLKKHSYDAGGGLRSTKSKDVTSNVPREVIGELIAQINRRDIGDLAHSHKITVLLKILDEAKRMGDKVLVFSSRLATLDFLENLMKMQKRPYSRLDGDTKISTRQVSVASFNSNDDDVYLISTTAGGVGLNIQGANRVVIMDFAWQPSNEQQAIGRAYRIGQTKPVFVYWLVVGGTYEQKLHASAIFKTQLASRVVDKKNPTPHASKVKTWMGPPEKIVHDRASLLRAQKHDELLTSMVISPTGDLICKVIMGDIFEEEEPEQLLSPVELQEAEHLVKMNQLRITDPEAYAKFMSTLVPRATIAPTVSQAATGSTTPVGAPPQAVPGSGLAVSAPIGIPQQLQGSSVSIISPSQQAGSSNPLSQKTIQAPLDPPSTNPQPAPKAADEPAGFGQEEADRISYSSWIGTVQAATGPASTAQQAPPVLGAPVPIAGAGTFIRTTDREQPSKKGPLEVDCDYVIERAKETKGLENLKPAELTQLGREVDAALKSKKLAGLPAVSSIRRVVSALGGDPTLFELVFSGQMGVGRLVTAGTSDFEAELAKVKEDILPRVADIEPSTTANNERGERSHRQDLAATRIEDDGAQAAAAAVAVAGDAMPYEKMQSPRHRTDHGPIGVWIQPSTPTPISVPEGAVASVPQIPRHRHDNWMSYHEASEGRAETVKSSGSGSGSVSGSGSIIMDSKRHPRPKEEPETTNIGGKMPSAETQRMLSRKKKRHRHKNQANEDTGKEPRLPGWANELSGSGPRPGDSKDAPLLVDD